MSKRRRGRGGAPTMYEHQPHVASVVSMSADGRRGTERSTTVDVPVETLPAYYQEDVATNARLEDANFRWDLNDDSLAPEGPPEDIVPDGINFGKKKRQENSVRRITTCVLH